jgi:hypothetical protein
MKLVAAVRFDALSTDLPLRRIVLLFSDLRHSGHHETLGDLAYLTLETSIHLQTDLRQAPTGQ